MPPIHDNQRVAVIADSQNLYHTAHSLYSRNLDYASLLESAVHDRELVRAISYVVRAHSPEEESFFDALQEIGFGSSTAEELVDAADSFVDMSENEKRYLL